jgi:hypothetical protein
LTNVLEELDSTAQQGSGITMSNRDGHVRMVLDVGAGVAFLLLSAVILSYSNPASSRAEASAPEMPYDLSVLKTSVFNPAVVGGQVTYTIIVNVTPFMAASAPANDAIVLNDVIPANTTFKSLTAPAGYSCLTPPVGGTGTITCTSASPIVAGQVQFTLIVDVPQEIDNQTIISNAVVVKPDLCLTEQCDDVLANDTSLATTEVINPRQIVPLLGTTGLIIAILLLFGTAVVMLYRPRSAER